MFRKTLIGAFAISAAAICVPAADAAIPRAESAFLVLSVTTSESPAKTGTLKCGPAGGNHKRPAAACHELTQVDGEFSELNIGPDRACTLQYDPVRVTATGHWRGKRVDFSTSYSNPCVLAVTAGPVFAV